MKVLWYEITIPKRYKGDTSPIAGWQDSLQEIVMQYNDIELYVVFEGMKGMTVKFIDGVTYIPIIPNMSLFGKKVLKLFNQQYTVDKLLPLLIKTVEEVKPDVIQIFGTEWGLGEIANYTDIPVVIHLMGCVAPYENAALPPGYSILDRIKTAGINPIKYYRLIRGMYYSRKWKTVEQNNFHAVSNYMGRTAWDKAMCELFHPGCNYFYCSEALRLSFVANTHRWSIPQNDRLQIVTIGCTTHWKGMDTVLKTANILKKYGIKFEWKIAGKMRPSLKNEIEKKENLTFMDCNVNILGFVKSDDLVPLLLSSNIYVHTAYIDNSPNTICEAQYLGLPIIATYVGGIPSLIQNDKEGILVPANDPYLLAHEIIALTNDKERQQIYSQATSLRARERHAPASIYRDLLSCYNSLIQNRSQK
jgi:glycosyltransferase involved in cell wall biosynthesis